MTNTGAFQILSFEMARVPDAGEAMVESVTARCHRCNHVTTVNDGAIHHLSRGLVVHCANCGNRQALPNAALESARGGVRKGN